MIGGKVRKDETNPHFKSQYASLDAVIEAIQGALTEQGLAVLQDVTGAENGLEVVTTLLHESGEFIQLEPLPIPTVKNDAQGFGSAMTYGRRYQLMAFFKLAPADDDGQAATEAKQDERKELNAAIRENMKSIQAIKEGIATGELHVAAEAWFELDDQTKKSLWVAPSKGGPFSTEERRVMQSSEFREAANQEDSRKQTERQALKAALNGETEQKDDMAEN